MFKVTQEEILKQIEDVEIDRRDAAKQMAFHKKAAMEAESRLIEANLIKEKLKEQLRVLRHRTISVELTLREQDIAEFKAKLPELMKKI
jgi:hypothetical protein